MTQLTASDGAEISYRLDGTQGPWVLLLHGGYGSPTDWEEITRRLVATGRRVLRPTLRPHAGTNVPPGSSVAPPRVALDLVELLDHLDIQEAHLGGWSHGGVIALQLIHDNPTRIRSLLLVGTFGAYRSRDRRLDRRLVRQARATSLIGKLPPGLIGMMAGTMARRVISPSTLTASPVAAQGFLDSLRLNLASKLVSEAMALTYSFDARPWLGNIDVPTLIVTGSDDHIPTTLSDELAAAIPGSHIDRWQGGTHGVALDDPVRLMASYETLLARVR